MSDVWKRLCIYIGLKHRFFIKQLHFEDEETNYFTRDQIILASRLRDMKTKYKQIFEPRFLKILP